MERFLRFGIVGGIGFLINTIGLVLGVKIGLKPSLAGPVGAEFAILSNFLLNNFWTFSDKTITSWTVLPLKFLQFNVLSMGSVIIQFLSLKIGELIFDIKTYKAPLKNLPIIKKFFFSKLIPEKISLYFIFYVMGVGVGLIVNFIIYSQIIWK